MSLANSNPASAFVLWESKHSFVLSYISVTNQEAISSALTAFFIGALLPVSVDTLIYCVGLFQRCNKGGDRCLFEEAQSVMYRSFDFLHYVHGPILETIVHSRN